ncbi:AraC family transcriptional regulator [Archangium sp. Cb G35]|uniref:helix-turn-helix domain-containing protein n=1 Tax=Archangium sp. Cb G35 TaxID=1920190 RepID=UPI00116115BE|nr:AraC family transcriptional regulator [Archangium sp. Cb G35]
MTRTPQRSPPHVVTLDAMGAGGLPLRVIRIPGGQVPVIPPGPLVSTFFMIFVMTAGRGRARLMEPLEVRGGDIHLVPPGMEHQPLDMGNLEGWIVGFDPLLLRSLGPEWLPEPPRSRGAAKPTPVRSLFVRGLLRLRPGQARWQRIVHRLAELETELREARWGAENATYAWFVLLVTELLRELQEHAPLAPAMSGRLVHDSLAFIEAHCLRPLSLQDVAVAVGCTPSHLANVIREETGLTVGDWLREHRMAESRRRLRETGASIESIASQVGYTDVTHFIRTFRRAHGVTPRAWREQHRR